MARITIEDCLDKVPNRFSLVLIAVAWPFSLLTALAVFLDDGTPVLYRQTRVGLNGKCFDLEASL